MKDYLNGLDLFSGIAGFTIGLSKYVRPVAYCEIAKYPRANLLALQAENKIPIAPIWNDVTTLKGEYIPFPVDIICGGFPCQDISTAGNGIGLEGERSRLFFEIIRLAGELRPPFVFLENVPAITVRGLERVLLEFTALGYSSRWTIVSAGELGAPHLRERWWFLAYSNSFASGNERQTLVRGNTKLDQRKAISTHASLQLDSDSKGKPINLSSSEKRQDSFGFTGHGAELDTNTESFRWSQGRSQLQIRSGESPAAGTSGEIFTNATSEGFQRWRDAKEAWQTFSIGSSGDISSWPSWLPKPSLCRGDDGLSNRVDRIAELGNSVCPQAVQEAFERLIGLK